MKLAFSISGHRTGPEAVQAAVLAEHHGFEQVWLTEDYCERGAFSVAGAVAAVTERIEIGIGVVNPWTRHPILVAMEHAALDEIAEGRAILGVGTSNAHWMEDQLGNSFVRPLARLKESIDILQTTLAGERVSYAGEAFTVETRLAFQPVRVPPIYVGAKGRRALRLAGEIADGALLSVLSSPEYVSWARRQIAADIDVGAYVAFSCDKNAGAAHDAVRPTVATFLGVHGDHDITRVTGLDPDLARRFRQAWRAGNPAVDLVDDHLIDRFAVAGSPDDCAAGIAGLINAGLDTVAIRDSGEADVSNLMKMAGECWSQVT